MGITNFLEPGAFLLLIPALAILGFLLFRNFVSDDIGDRNERRRFRLIILASRAIIIALIIIALAKPYGEVTITTPGDPKITILVDKSASMQVMDTEFLDTLTEQLREEFPVTVREVGTDTASALGEEILSYLEKDTNLLLVTDGHSNYGTSLEDAALLASGLNSTLSAIRIKDNKPEIGVSVIGPDTSVNGVNQTYIVRVVNLGNQEANLRVVVDNQEIYNQPAKNGDIQFDRDFAEGDHRIFAEVISSKDTFANNNRFHKVVSVVKKPKVLLVQNAQDPVEQIFRELYDVTKVTSIPANVNDYYAVIINDMPANIQGVERLADYLIDKDGGYYGNGVFVIGGFDSFDRGGYKGSVLETYLPVTVGQAARKRGSSNIAIAIDLSSSSGEFREISYRNTTNCVNMSIYDYRDQRVVCEVEIVDVKSTVDQNAVNKALAASIINSLGPDNQVGAVIYASKFGKVQELAPLFKTKNDFIDKIGRAEFPKAYDSEKDEYYGQNLNEDLSQGLTGAYSLLKDHTGNQNIILISNGGGVKFEGDTSQKRAIDTAKTLNSYGVKIYVVGSGRNAANINEKFLNDIAYNGGGVYFPADRSNSLKILFGDDNSKFGETFDLFILNPYHYITQGLSLQVSLYGFNQVVPRPNALQLVITQHGESALTAWNYGLGRVATLNVFSGNNNLGELLNKKNSILLTRTVNWAIGDPQRKEDYYVVIPDARVNTSADIIVKSSKYPNVEGLSLTKVNEKQYKATILPKTAGFSEVLGKSYGVNYEEEYQDLGLNPGLEKAVALTGGKMFRPDAKNEIVKFVNSVSKRTRSERTTIVWPFLFAAAVIFLLEIIARRAREYQLNS